MSHPATLAIEAPGNHALSISTRYREADGDLVAFLHGFGCAKESFDQAFTTPQLADYSLLSFDWPGHGQSDKPNNFSYSMTDYATIGLEILNQYKTKRISLVAHSMGGAIGLLMAPHIENLATFINVEGNLVSEDAGIVSRRTAQQTEQTFVEQGYDDFLHALEQSDRSDLRSWGHWYSQAGKIALHRSAQSLVEWSDSGKLLEQFNSLHSTTYIHGDEESKDYLLPHFGHTTTAVIPATGHFMMLDDPRAFYTTISNALLDS